MPNDVTVAVSSGDVPDRLDVGWTSPTDDAATQLFATNDGGERETNQPITHDTYTCDASSQ